MISKMSFKNLYASSNAEESVTYQSIGKGESQDHTSLKRTYVLAFFHSLKNFNPDIQPSQQAEHLEPAEHLMAQETFQFR